MASSNPTCDICSSQQKSAPADIWCLECEESLCVECSKHHAVSKATRNHDTLPITEYTSLPDFIQRIEKHCTNHNEQYTVYCHEHACPACTSCVLKEHKLCSKVSKIEAIVGNAKSSSTLTEIEKTLRDVSKNIIGLHLERMKNMASLQEQKTQIEETITAIRLKINKQLDTIQSQMVRDLRDSEKREREKIEAVLKSLSVQKTQVEQLQKNIASIKKHASDLQAFLAIREIEHRCDELSKKVINMSEAGDFNNSNLQHKVQVSTSDLPSFDFGKIVTEISPSHVKLITSKDKQAQLPVNMSGSCSIESVSVKLNRTINTECMNARGCVILPDGRSFFTCYIKDTITCYDKDGKRQYIKKLEPSAAFDIAYSEEMNKIFISSGFSDVKQFHEMNLNDGNIKPIDTDLKNYGVVVKQNKLIYCADDVGLCERSLSDGSVRVIVSDPRLPVYCYVTEYHHHLYYTNNKDNSVTCCGIDGRQIWKFTNDVLLHPSGVSVDNHGNVYVVGWESDNVVVISADGQRHKEILSKEDGLKDPLVLYYQRSTNQLLVANGEDTAFLFGVCYNGV